MGYLLPVHDDHRRFTISLQVWFGPDCVTGSQSPQKLMKACQCLPAVSVHFTKSAHACSVGSLEILLKELLETVDMCIHTL